MGSGCLLLSHGISLPSSETPQAVLDPCKDDSTRTRTHLPLRTLHPELVESPELPVGYDHQDWSARGCF